MTLEEFFVGYKEARPLFDALYREIAYLGAVQMRITKSQIAFQGRRAFAWAWTPRRYLHGAHAPLVLSLALARKDGSARWKEVAEPAPGRWMHHLELWDCADIDDEVRCWIQEAWQAMR